MDPVWVGQRRRRLHLRSRRRRERLELRHRSRRSSTQLTHFSDYDVKTLDAATDGSAVVFEQAGYIHLLDPKTGKEHVVPITATGDFPWMMPQWKDVSRER